MFNSKFKITLFYLLSNLQHTVLYDDFYDVNNLVINNLVIDIKN